MRLLTLVLIFFVLANTASAGPKNVKHIVTAVPRAFGRTAQNMVTFKERGLAINQWVLMAAVLVDAKTSLDLTRRCPQPCENYGFIWGAHPSATRVYGLLGATGFYYSTINQALWEISYTEEEASGRAFERYFPLMLAVIHARFAVRNTQIQPPPSSGSDPLSQVPAELRADHAVQ